MNYNKPNSGSVDLQESIIAFFDCMCIASEGGVSKEDMALALGCVAMDAWLILYALNRSGMIRVETTHKIVSRWLYVDTSKGRKYYDTIWSTLDRYYGFQCPEPPMFGPYLPF